MIMTLFLVAVGVVLFAAAYATKRRFGALCLALIAGELLSRLWVGDLTPLVAEAGFVLIKPPLGSVVSAALIVLPAILLLFSGPSTHRSHERIYGSLVFAALGVVLLFEPVTAAFVVEGVGETVREYIVRYRPIVLTTGVVLALLDLFMTHTPKHMGHTKR